MVPVCSGLIPDVEVVQEGVVWYNRALIHHRGAIRPICSGLEEAMPMLCRNILDQCGFGTVWDATYNSRSPKHGRVLEPIPDVDSEVFSLYPTISIVSKCNVHRQLTVFPLRRGDGYTPLARIVLG